MNAPWEGATITERLEESEKGEMAYYVVGRWPTTVWAWRNPARAELVLRGRKAPRIRK